MKKVFEDLFEVEATEDGGQAMIAHIDGGEGNGMFVRVQSWDETKRHEDFKKFVGKQVRVTVEVLE